MKKSLLKILVLVVSVSIILTFSLAATTTAAEKKVTLILSIWDKLQLPAVETMANNFTKLHPNITVKTEVTPWTQYWMKLDTVISSGGGPDVFWMNCTSLPMYASNGVLLPISDKIKADNVDMGNYYESLIAQFNYKGELYALPSDLNATGLWYNKTLFDAAGVKYPDETWDWSTLMDAAKKLTDASKGIYGIAAWLQHQGGYYDTIAQAGGFVISPDKKTSGFDKPEAIAGLKFWTDLIEAGVSPTIQQMADTAPESLFASGKVAMIYDGSWMAIEYGKNNEYTKDKVDVAVLPKGVKRATTMTGNGYSINAKTKYPEEAWLLTQYLAGKEAAELQAETGTIIPAFKGTQEAWVESIPNLNLKAIIDSASYGVPFPVSMSVLKRLDVERKYLKQAWAGEITVEDAAKKISTEVNALLEAEK